MSIRVLFVLVLLTVFVLLIACSSDKTTSPKNPRSIVVTIKNLESVKSMHIYFDLDEPTDENLVPPKDSIITQVEARQIGQSKTVHVAEGDKRGAPAFYSTTVRVTQNSWESREEELQWTGVEIVPVGW